jgi:hypothetical protein
MGIDDLFLLSLGEVRLSQNLLNLKFTWVRPGEPFQSYLNRVSDLYIRVLFRGKCVKFKWLT